VNFGPQGTERPWINYRCSSSSKYMW